MVGPRGGGGEMDERARRFSELSRYRGQMALFSTTTLLGTVVQL